MLMKTKLFSLKVRALTLIEVIVVVAMMALLILVVLPSLRPRGGSSKSPRMTCVLNLKQIGLSFRLFATDHGDRFPMQVSTNEGGSLEYVGTGLVFEHFRTLSNDLNVPKVLICPSDDGRIQAKDFGASFYTNKNVSYFLGLDATETKPYKVPGSMILGGDRNVVVNGRYHHGIFKITANTQVGWTKSIHKGNGNVVLADGSVRQLSTTNFQPIIHDMGNSTNRFSIPD